MSFLPGRRVEYHFSPTAPGFGRGASLTTGRFPDECFLVR